MTSDEFYKYTSDMAYQVSIYGTIEDEDAIVAKIGMAGKTPEDAEKVLRENSFFAIDLSREDERKLDLDNVSLVVEFHFGVDNWNAYYLNVCDVIDCRPAGGKFVLSCTGDWELIREQRPDTVEAEDADADGEPCDSAEDSKKEDVKEDCEPEGDGVFGFLDGFFRGFREFDFPKFPDFLKFPDFPKFTEYPKLSEPSGDAKASDKNTSDFGDDRTKYYSFTCTMDPKGNVTLKHSSNDKEWEKRFKAAEGLDWNALAGAVKGATEKGGEGSRDAK